MEELKTEWNLEVCKACCDFELSVLLLVNENDEIIRDDVCFNLNKLSDVSSVDNLSCKSIKEHDCVIFCCEVDFSNIIW